MKSMSRTPKTKSSCEDLFIRKTKIKKYNNSNSLICKRYQKKYDKNRLSNGFYVL